MDNKGIILGRKIRLALVGCGRIAEKHIKALQSHQNEIELVAISDNNRDIVDKKASELKVPAYLEPEQMFKEKDIDVVSLCTPSGLHAPQTILAAQHGAHVVTEKPMATTWQDGIDMVKACEDAKVQLFVVKQNRGNETLKLIKKAIENERFGQIYHVNVNVYWTRPQSYYDEAPWRGTAKMDGGAFMNQASHYVDLLHWLIGPVSSVQAMTTTLARKIEVEDTGVVNIRWQNGAVGSMNVCMLTYPKNLEASITILGEKGTVKLGGVAVNEIQEWKFEDLEDGELENVKKANELTTSAIGFGHAGYYQNVIDVLRGNAKAETDGEEGLLTLELLMAIAESAKSHHMIQLPLSR